MKVTKTQSGHNVVATFQGQPAFQPVELKITIESAEELRVLKHITAACFTNSEAMVSDGTLDAEDSPILANMFAEMYKAL